MMIELAHERPSLQMIYKFMMIELAHERPSSTHSLHQDCGSVDVEQFPETEFIGWVRLVVCIFDQIIYGGDTANTSQTVHNLDAYILILPSVSPKTLPGGRGRVSSTIFSSG